MNEKSEILLLSWGGGPRSELIEMSSVIPLITQTTPERTYPVPRFPRQQLLKAYQRLVSIGLNNEWAKSLIDRLPVASADKQEKEADVWLSITNPAYRREKITNYYTLWERTRNQDDDSVILYALLIDGFALELNMAKRDIYASYSYPHESCETPLTQAVYDWPEGALLLLDLPSEYGLDVNKRIPIHGGCKGKVCVVGSECKEEPTYCFTNALFWAIQGCRIELLDRIMIRCTDLTLNESCLGSIRKRPIELAIRLACNLTCDQRLEIFKIFLNHAHEDGTGVSLTVKPNDALICLDDADLSPAVLEQFKNRTEQIRNYQLALRKEIHAVIQITPLIELVLSYTIVGLQK